jgi:hypothetical protein
VPVTLLNLPQANLARNAAFSSVPTPGPVALPADCQSLVCTLTMSAADQAAPANLVTWTVYVAPPGPAPAGPPPGNGWVGIAQEQWQGGTFTDHQGASHPANLSFAESVPPQFRGGWAAAAGQNLGPTLRVGCTVASNP